MGRKTFFLGLILALMSLFALTVVTAQDFNDAKVNDMASTLRLREAPSPLAATIVELKGNTPLKLVGRTADNRWLKVETQEGQTGWVSADFVRVFVPLANVPVLNEGLSVPSTGTTTTTTPATPAAPVARPEGANASVIDMAFTLRLRATPSALGGVITELPGSTPLTAIGKSDNLEWLNVTTANGTTGWVSRRYVTLFVTLDELPVTGAAGVSLGVTGTTSAANVGTVRGVRDIYLRGQAAGNNRNAFTKVGDSMSVNVESYDAIGRGLAQLGGYASLQRVIEFFTTSGFNSFTHSSVAAGPGWTTTMVLDPAFLNSAVCKELESPLECELDRIKPSVALIQLGTNDLQYLNVDQFGYNMDRIVEIAIGRGVIPVIATIPYREGFGEKVDQFNAVIKEVASRRGVPLWDVKTVFDGLPNRGISADGIHPSLPPAGYADTANFANQEALRSGYTVRNLSALQILERVLAAMGN